MSVLPIALFRGELGGRLRSLSPGVATLTGYSPEALLARDDGLDGLLRACECELLRARRTELAEGESFHLELHLRHAAGRYLPVALCAVREPADELAGVLLARGDAEARAARHQQRRLELMSGIAGSVVHHLNNGLTPIINYGQLARRLAARQPRLVEALEGIISEGQRLVGTTRALADLGRRPPNEGLRPQAPAALVEACHVLLRCRLRDEGIVFNVEVEDELPHVGAIGQELLGLLEELIENARVSLQARFPAKDPAKQILLRATREGAGVELAVVDRGHGFEPALVPRLFAPYYSTRPGASGLGLCRCREIAQRHRGELSAEGRPGAGATFRLRLPAWPH